MKELEDYPLDRITIANDKRVQKIIRKGKQVISERKSGSG
jgi:hypothetical protein